MLAVPALLFGSPVAAQGLFEWPARAVDVSTYSTVEECAAAVQRTARHIRSREILATGIWRDTLPPDPAEHLKPVPPELRETARRCLMRFADPDSVPLEDYGWLIPLYLYAEWDDKAKALGERRLAAVAPDADAELAAIIDTLLTIYRSRALAVENGALVAPVPKTGLFDEVMSDYVPRVKDRVQRFLMYQGATDLAQARIPVDTARRARELARMLLLADSLTEDERFELAKRTRGRFRHDGDLGDQVAAVGELAALFSYGLTDTLRHSTKAYVKAVRTLLARAYGIPEAELPIPVGKRAPALDGDYWLGCGEVACGPRPTPGRVSLVLFVDFGASACGRIDRVQLELSLYGNCAEVMYSLRRLMKRFPELQVTIAARTEGHFKYVKEHLDPEAEAQLIRRWVDAYAVGAALSVTSTRFWRLSDHDRRRINEKTANEKRYSFGGVWNANNSAFLIDEAGIVIWAWPLYRESEVFFTDLARILLERNRTGA